MGWRCESHWSLRSEPATVLSESAALITVPQHWSSSPQDQSKRNDERSSPAVTFQYHYKLNTNISYFFQIEVVVVRRCPSRNCCWSLILVRCDEGCDAMWPQRHGDGSFVVDDESWDSYDFEIAEEVKSMTWSACDWQLCRREKERERERGGGGRDGEVEGKATMVMMTIIASGKEPMHPKVKPTEGPVLMKALGKTSSPFSSICSSLFCPFSAIRSFLLSFLPCIQYVSSHQTVHYLHRIAVVQWLLPALQLDVEWPVPFPPQPTAWLEREAGRARRAWSHCKGTWEQRDDGVTQSGHAIRMKKKSWHAAVEVQWDSPHKGLLRSCIPHYLRAQNPLQLSETFFLQLIIRRGTVKLGPLNALHFDWLLERSAAIVQRELAVLDWSDIGQDSQRKD